MNGGSARKVFIYGCGVVAPGAANLKEFLQQVWEQRQTLTLEDQLADLFLVGKPKFNFDSYKDWIVKRHAPSRFNQLAEKSLANVRMAVGTTIDALNQNPQLEEAIRKLDPRVLVVCGTGVGDLNASFDATHAFHEALAEWNRFWSQPVRNSPCRDYLDGKVERADVPESPKLLPEDSLLRHKAWLAWDAFWAPQSELLQEYLRELMTLEYMAVGADVAQDKLNLIRTKQRAKKQMLEKYKHPLPPWEAVSPNLLWNVLNAPAAQVSMLLGIHGPSWTSSGACATFGLVIKQALDALRSGEYDLAVVTTTDVPPTPELVSGFYNARVLAGGQKVSVPLTEMRGTHVSGGAVTWIIGVEEVLQALDVKHTGVEILGAGLSSDAEHIITPSLEGPKLSIRRAFESAGISADEIDTWDMHATATPGDSSEFQLIEGLIPARSVISARKGLFGHAMGSCGGLEATAQVFAVRKTGTVFQIPPSGISQDAIHPSIRAWNRIVATDTAVDIPTSKGQLTCGKLNMGVGGLSSCVITRVQ